MQGASYLIENLFKILQENENEDNDSLILCINVIYLCLPSMKNTSRVYTLT